MARAMLKKPKQGERTDLNGEPPSKLREVVSQSALYQARYLLRHDEEMARSVMSGASSLNAAYQATTDRIDTPRVFRPQTALSSRRYFPPAKPGPALTARPGGKAGHQRRVASAPCERL
jgi:hypothetical protein